MALKNLKEYVPPIKAHNEGIVKIDQLELTGRSSAPTDSNLANGRLYYDTAGALYARIGDSWVSLGTGGGGVTSWDGIYDTDKTLVIDDGTLTFSVTGNTAGLTINKSAIGAGTVLAITNAGTGNDIGNTSASWYIKRSGTTGILELGSGGTINATDGTLTIGSVATTTTFAGSVTVTSTAIITGTADSTCFTVTAGDVLIANGKIVQANDDTDTALAITADSVTTGIVIDINADGITSGTILHLDSLAAGMTTGLFIDCYDGAASAFSVGLYGTTVIAGAAATNVFTITAGDVVLLDTSITMTDADNAASFLLTNNIATTASVFVLAGSGVFTGSTTTSFMTVTASGLTTGTGIYIPFAALTTGKGVHIYGAAETTGSLLYINQDGEALAAGELLTINNTESGALTAKTGNLTSIYSSMTETTANRTEDYNTLLIDRRDISNNAGFTLTSTGSILKLAKTSTQTAGTLTDSVIGLEVVMAAAGTGAGVSVTHSAAVGTCFVGANDATTTGIGGLSLTHTTSVITTGSVAKISSTGVDTGTGQGTLLDLVSSGAAAACVVKLTTAALTSGSAFQVVANALTTGLAIDVQHTTSVLRPTV